MSSLVAGPPEVVVDYPEGPRVPEGNLQTRRRRELVSALLQWYRRRGVGDAWVCSDINVYYREGDRGVVVAPDVAVAFGVDAAAQEPRSTYKVWEAGAAPCFVLEILSPSTWRVDARDKPAKYGELGVDEYWRFDPTGGELMDPPLQGERRRGGRWAPIGVVPDEGGLRGRSERLGLDLCWRPPKLRLWDIAAGAWLPDLDDEAARADEEAAARRAADIRAGEAAARAGEEAAARRAADIRAGEAAARAGEEAAARRAADIRADEEAAARRAADARAGEAAARAGEEAAARRAADIRAGEAAARAGEEAAARRAADVRAGEQAARADEEAAARRAVEAELAELRARLNGRS